jgi:hypothetical protein
VPIEVGRFTTDVTVADGDLPLSPAQLEKLVQLVARRVEEKQRDQARSREATAIRGQASPPVQLG